LTAEPGRASRPSLRVNLPANIVRAIFLVTAGCSSSPSRTECEPIVNHMVDLFTQGKLGDEPKPPKEYTQAVDKWRQLLKDATDATHETMLSVCTSQMSSSASSCVLAAHSELELARCFGG
jgi:hypothetical protein